MKINRKCIKLRKFFRKYNIYIREYNVDDNLSGSVKEELNDIIYKRKK